MLPAYEILDSLTLGNGNVNISVAPVVPRTTSLATTIGPASTASLCTNLKSSRAAGLRPLPFHETWPGHHLQVATAQKIEELHPISRIIWFSGPGEGWARYSESLAEEMELYNTTTGPILRRAWPARGMVVDPGIHMFDWTREQAVEFMRESGRHPSEERLHATVDRIAILPGQLTAYDSGGLEILALRAEAKKAFGDEFDIREFHDRVLENGPTPLSMLRQQIEAWIESKM